MTKLYQLGFVAILSSISVISFAGGPNCSSLIQKGEQKSVIPNAGGVSISDIEACLPTCGSSQTGNPVTDAQYASRCVSSLKTLAFAVNYNNSISGLDPNQFTSAPAPGPFGSSLPTSGGYQSAGSQSAYSTPVPTPAPVQQTAQQPVTPSYEAPAPSATHTYIANPGVVNKISDAAAKKNDGIRWY